MAGSKKKEKFVDPTAVETEQGSIRSELTFVAGVLCSVKTGEPVRITKGKVYDKASGKRIS